jgi:hypothetical protein
MEKFPLSYFLLWRNYRDEFFGPVPGKPFGDDFKTMVSNKNVLMLKEVTQ